MTTAATPKPRTSATRKTTAARPAPTTRRGPTRLSDDEVQKLFGLLSGADSTELKLTVPPASHRDTIRGLPIDPVESQPRQVYFFDTPDLALNKAGIVVRARRIAGGKGDTVIKLRPVVPGDMPAEFRTDPSFKVEVDVLPGGYVCSASFKGALGPGDAVKQVAGGDRAIRKLYSKDQRAFYAAHAPDGLGLDDLAVLGPITVLKLKFTPPGATRRMVAELWLYPDGERILELSTKCAPAEGFQVAAEARAFLAERGVDLWGEQHTKTRTALEFFSRSLQEGA
jgi:hypothetical protein